MSSKSDKPLVTKILIICLLIIASWQFAFAHFSAANYLSGWYIATMVVLTCIWGYSIVQAYKQADSGTKDNSSRGWVIGITVVILLFVAIWAASANEKVAPGSPQMEDVR